MRQQKSAMKEIYKFIKNSDDCHFTVDELKNVSTNVALDNRTIKIRLKVKYGSRIIITEKPGKFICFIDNCQDILSQAWSDKKNLNEKEERLKILKAAAARNDIRSCVFDNTMYPPSSRMFENINTDIPDSLSYFLEQVILKNKRHNMEHLKLVCTNTSHKTPS